ncbi:MAG: EVE domain-containing protein [Nostoc sp. NOS(2021)]|nr:EVE domain-containing protein [Nostoc sp. NOS(2021)]
MGKTKTSASSEKLSSSSSVRLLRIYWLISEWQTVLVEFVETFSQTMLLSRLTEEFSSEELMVVRPGNRLSVMPVSKAVALKILAIKTS